MADQLTHPRWPEKKTGIAPINRDSGTLRGHRCIFGRRADVRAGLYMATVSAMHHNHVIKSLYDRLKAAGKAFKVAMIACKRKLRTVLNVMVKNDDKLACVGSLKHLIFITAAFPVFISERRRNFAR